MAREGARMISLKNPILNDAGQDVFDVWGDSVYLGQVCERGRDSFSCWVSGQPFTEYRREGLRAMMDFWRAIARGEK